jgi:hypothetical protein
VYYEYACPCLSVQFSVDFSRFSKMKTCKFVNLLILLLLVFFKFVNSGCIKDCICRSETELKCFNIERNDYNNFKSLATKRETIYFYKSTIKDCHVLDCSPLYNTLIEGCDDDNDFTTHEITTELYNHNNNNNITWQALLGALSVILPLAICVTILR